MHKRRTQPIIPASNIHTKKQYEGQRWCSSCKKRKRKTVASSPTAHNPHVPAVVHPLLKFTSVNTGGNAMVEMKRTSIPKDHNDATVVDIWTDINNSLIRSMSTIA